MSERGSAQILYIVALISGLVLFITGVYAGSTYYSTIKGSAAKLPVVNQIIGTTEDSTPSSTTYFKLFPSPTPTKSSVQSSTSSTNSSQTNSSSNPAVSETINATGSYTYAGQTIYYNISFPRSGGGVSGTIGGFCQGKVDGKFDGGDKGLIAGGLSGKCGVFPLSQSFTASYNGTVYLKEGRIDLNWIGNIPFTDGKGNLSLYFQP